MPTEYPQVPPVPGHARVRADLPGQRLTDHEKRLQRAQAARSSDAQQTLSGTNSISRSRSFLVQPEPVEVPGARVDGREVHVARAGHSYPQQPQGEVPGAQAQPAAAAQVVVPRPGVGIEGDDVLRLSRELDALKRENFPGRW